MQTAIENDQASANPAPTAPLYTELPYPGDGVVRTTGARILQAALRKHAPSLLHQRGLRIADVGCGTGEVTAGLAVLFPDAQVVGIDINPASLALARDLARQQRLNISFAQCDIADDLWGAVQAAGVLPADARFDVVVSLGVLHHLHDPMQGFAQVRRIIRPEGLFLGYIYSRHGRWDEMAIKGLLDSGLPADASFQERAAAIHLLRLWNPHSIANTLKRLGRRIRFGPPLAPWELAQTFFKRNNLIHLSDSFSNPCEHLYAFGELKALFEKTGWSFVALADRGGLPVTPEDYTRHPQTLALLKRLPPDVLYDYFAFRFRAAGFTFVLRPTAQSLSAAATDAVPALRDGAR